MFLSFYVYFLSKTLGCVQGRRTLLIPVTALSPLWLFVQKNTKSQEIVTNFGLNLPKFIINTYFLTFFIAAFEVTPLGITLKIIAITFVL